MSARLAVVLAFGLFAAIPAIATSAAAHEYKVGALTIDHPWARASAGNAKNGAAYMTITNDGPEPDRLLSATTPAAAMAELHVHIMDSDGVMKMRPVEAIELAPGEATALAPGGLHLMLMGLSAPLIEDQSFPLTLVFEAAGRIEVSVTIASVATMHETHGGSEGGQ
jgi:copper(I)-binding protein